MKIYLTILYVIGVLAVKNSVAGKTLIFNKYSNGPHLDEQKQDDVAFDDSKQNLDNEDVETLINSYKRSADDSLKPLKRNIFDGNVRKRSPYGLVYNQGKPIGILEPIPQSFEYSAYSPRDSPFRNSAFKSSQWFPVKRESDADMDEMAKEQLESQTSALHSSNYANVLAKFKVNNKVKHRPYQDYLNSQVKRATNPDLHHKKEIDELKKRGALDMGDLKANAKTKVKGNLASEEIPNKVDANKIDEIEENLKDVMGDMGLVEKDKDTQENDGNVKKREIYFEDEDLENGLNKIGLTKESHYDRNKKEDCPGKTKVAKSKGSKKFAIDKGFHKKGKKKVRKDDESNAKRSIKSNRKRVATKKDINGDLIKRKVANYQYEGEEFIRRKRQGKEAEKAEDSEIMKGLESSGDLTVSGNKSPLVAVSSADDVELKKSQEKRDKEELEYEKRLERNIQDKINSIKEEVKREITKFKSKDAKKDQQRKKREIATNTLLDEETSVLDPGINIDQKLEPHIRKRRDLDKDSSAAHEEPKKKKREVDNNAAGEIASKMNAETEVKAEKREITDLTENIANEKVTEIAQRLKRNDDNISGIKKDLENEQDNKADKSSFDKREDKMATADTKIDADAKASSDLNKRSSNDQSVKSESSQNGSGENKINKNIEKRNNAYAATDKIETDNQSEFGTDIPDSIVKRNDQTPASLNGKKADEGNPEALHIVKRSEDISNSAKDKLDDSSAPVKNEDIKTMGDSEMREDRSAIKPSLVDLQTGQTIIKDLDLEDHKEAREERQSPNANTISKTAAKSSSEIEAAKDNEEEEATRNERSPNKLNKHNANKHEKMAVNHKNLRRTIAKDRNRRGVIKSDTSQEAVKSIEGKDAEKKVNLLNPAESESSLDEGKDNIKERDVQNENADKIDDAIVKERSASSREKLDSDASDASLNERSAYAKHNLSICTDAEFAEPNAEGVKERSSGLAESNLQNLNTDVENVEEDLNDEIAIDKRKRRRRSTKQKRRIRRKRDESSYSENKPELINYRADNDGEIDDEDDEMQDDGFNDQTANFLTKRQADYDSINYENGDDREANEDYPMFILDRNKRNALRVYDDENDAEESNDNFLFYPNRYSRTKRHNYENLAAFHGGGMMKHAAARRERNMQPYEQSLRRKRLEKINRNHEQNENGNVAELSESDIFGGFPQSYEGELSRFKRVKRSIPE